MSERCAAGAAIALLALAAVAGGCATLGGGQAPATSPADPASIGPGPAESPPPPDRPPSPDPELLQRIADLELELLEKQARILELERRLEERERRLDETVEEVLRAKSKLRSRESRAEAASAIAEAEIALQAVRRDRSEADVPELRQAEALLQTSAREFDAGNFGGALYLAGQVRGHLQLARARQREREDLPPVAGEVLFASPLSMRVVTPSNVRSGPGLEHEVARTLRADSKVSGHSYQGRWIRVRTGDGLVGWIHQSLLEVD